MCSVSILLYIMLSRQVRDGIARSSKHTADEVKALRSVLSMLDDIEDVFATKAAKGVCVGCPMQRACALYVLVGVR